MRNPLSCPLPQRGEGTTTSTRPFELCLKLDIPMIQRRGVLSASANPKRAVASYAGPSGPASPAARLLIGPNLTGRNWRPRAELAMAAKNQQNNNLAVDR